MYKFIDKNFLFVFLVFISMEGVEKKEKYIYRSPESNRESSPKSNRKDSSNSPKSNRESSLNSPKSKLSKVFPDGSDGVNEEEDIKIIQLNNSFEITIKSEDCEIINPNYFLNKDTEGIVNVYNEILRYISKENTLSEEGFEIKNFISLLYNKIHYSAYPYKPVETQLDRLLKLISLGVDIPLEKEFESLHMLFSKNALNEVLFSDKVFNTVQGILEKITSCKETNIFKDNETIKLISGAFKGNQSIPFIDKHNFADEETLKFYMGSSLAIAAELGLDKPSVFGSLIDKIKNHLKSNIVQDIELFANSLTIMIKDHLDPKKEKKTRMLFGGNKQFLINLFETQDNRFKEIIKNFFLNAYIMMALNEKVIEFCKDAKLS